MESTLYLGSSEGMFSKDVETPILVQSGIDQYLPVIVHKMYMISIADSTVARFT